MDGPDFQFAAWSETGEDKRGDVGFVLQLLLEVDGRFLTVAFVPTVRFIPTFDPDEDGHAGRDEKRSGSVLTDADFVAGNRLISGRR